MTSDFTALLIASAIIALGVYAMCRIANNNIRDED